MKSILFTGGVCLDPPGIPSNLFALKIIFCKSLLEEVAFFSGNLRWLWRILANSLRIVGGLLREPDSLDRAIDIGDLGGVVRAIDNAAFVLRGYADPFLRLVLCVKLLVGCCMYSIFFPPQALTVIPEISAQSCSSQKFRGRTQPGDKIHSSSSCSTTGTPTGQQKVA